MNSTSRGELTPYEYLRARHEKMPEWLGNFAAEDDFPRREFFESRIVYYPGSGTDGHPVKLFGSAQAVFCFVYADYGLTRHNLIDALEHPQHGFRGYHRLARRTLRESDLVLNGWTSHIAQGEVDSASARRFARVADEPFGFLEVLERDPELDENHGAKRLAILFLGADGYATYDALFCQGGSQRRPFAVVLQDHGFGGNYDRFGGGGLLEQIAQRCQVLPEFLLVAEDTRAWEGFERVPGVCADRGGMHNDRRHLFHQVGSGKEGRK